MKNRIGLSIFIGICVGISISLKIIVPSVISDEINKDKYMTLLEFKKRQGY